MRKAKPGLPRDRLTCNRLARLNPDGTLDPNFDTGTGIESDGGVSVNALALQDDAKFANSLWHVCWVTRQGINNAPDNRAIVVGPGVAIDGSPGSG